MKVTPSKYYKLPIGEGLEALSVKDYNSSFPSHFHPTYNITLIYDGSFNTKLDNSVIVAPSGTILITNPQEIHSNPFDKNGSVSFFTFYVSQDFLEYCNQSKSIFFNQKVVYDQELFASLHQLAVAIDQAHALPNYEEQLKQVLFQLALRHGNELAEVQDTKIQSLFDEFLAEQNLNKFSLEEAAKRFGIDKFKFIRLFKFQTGLTPNNYFILKRIEKSKSMLKEGQELLSIAIELGFYDAAHYCNYFKKFTGISPIAYSTNR